MARSYIIQFHMPIQETINHFSRLLMEPPLADKYSNVSKQSFLIKETTLTHL